MGLYPMTPETGPFTTRGLVTHVRKRGQRWYSLACFGNKSHYRADGTCEHTDALVGELTPRGLDLTKIKPFGAGERVPKKYAEAKLRPIPATTQTRRESVANPESPAVAGRDDG